MPKNKSSKNVKNVKSVKSVKSVKNDDKNQIPINSTVKPSLKLLKWPTISFKSNLQLKTLLENQIVIIPSFLTSQECTNLINFIDQNIPLEKISITSFKKKSDEAFRDNDRFSIEDIKFAEYLYNDTGLSSLISQQQHSQQSWTSSLLKNNDNDKVSGLNSNIRIYKYNTGQRFEQHYDDSVKDFLGRKSDWTLLIYLNGGENDYEMPLLGGETVFYKSKKHEIIVKPERGMALLHKHGHDCLLHEAKEVKKGFKYVLRSDLMFS
ncbi:hypothetical protein Glove_22g17 [Diversispora epigaea]|uniref:Fe2OG dioxygenase domain-containing protein n=1 Tax=Diversispora epigaea TaxID=1348612 RepID=A0A397JNR4_9GLOM|nr:hypothetical protein Glove_22g17 [Diversispora epigaea]